MINLVSVFLGGGIGALLRHLLCVKIGGHWAFVLVGLIFNPFYLIIVN